MLLGTDLVLTLPAGLARAAGARHGLVAVAPPLELPGFTLALFWHERWHHDPRHAWVRARLGAIAAGEDADGG